MFEWHVLVLYPVLRLYDVDHILQVRWTMDCNWSLLPDGKLATAWV